MVKTIPLGFRVGTCRVLVQVPTPRSVANCNTFGVFIGYLRLLRKHRPMPLMWISPGGQHVYTYIQIYVCIYIYICLSVGVCALENRPARASIQNLYRMVSHTWIQLNTMCVWPTPKQCLIGRPCHFRSEPSHRKTRTTIVTFKQKVLHN